jgi:TRAP-type mannitol/chloroaromatic compound transport system permease small subunit
MLNILKKVAKPLSRITDGIAMGSNTLGTLVVLLLVLAVDYDVLARGLFNKPFMGAVEVVQFSMVLIVFLQLPDVMRVNRLTRSEGFLIVMEPRFPVFIRFVRRVIDAVSSTLMVLIAIAIWPEFLDMFETQDYFGVPGIFTAPWWPIKLTIFLSAVLCALILIFKVILGEEKVHIPLSGEKS